MILPVTLVIAAATGLINVWLAFGVGRNRVSSKINLGDGGEAADLASQDHGQEETDRQQCQRPDIEWRQGQGGECTGRHGQQVTGPAGAGHPAHFNP